MIANLELASQALQAFAEYAEHIEHTTDYMPILRLYSDGSGRIVDMSMETKIFLHFSDLKELLEWLEAQKEPRPSKKEAQHIKAGDVLLYEHVPVFSQTEIRTKAVPNKVTAVGQVYNSQINIEYLSANGETVLRAFPYRQVLDVEV